MGVQMDVLRIRSLCKSYNKGKDWQNHKINVTIGQGEIVGFLGMNGAGKTTLLKSITGIHTFDSGSVEICDYDLVREPIKAKLCFGYIPDNHSTFEKLTGREYVNFSANMYKVPQKERDERVEKYLELFNLAYAYDRQIKSYSHGMKQKIALIGSFIHNPDLWILDEPLVGLDVKGQQEVISLLKSVREQNKSVFFSSHNMDIVERICDRAVLIKNGKMIKEYDIKDYKKKPGTLEDDFTKMVEANDDPEPPTTHSEVEADEQV